MLHRRERQMAREYIMKLFLFIIFLCGIELMIPGNAQASSRWSVNLHIGSGNHYHDPYYYNHWHHGYYEPRNSWWVGNNDWNYYSAPAPLPTPPYYPLPPSSPPISIAPAPLTPHMPTEEDPTLFYCAYSNAYYPNVRACPGGWELQSGKRAQ
jgi:hypothetical protein